MAQSDKLYQALASQIMLYLMNECIVGFGPSLEFIDNISRLILPVTSVTKNV